MREVEPGMASVVGLRIGYAGWILAGLATSALAMPTAATGLFSESPASVSLKALGTIGSFTPANVDPDLAAQFRIRALRGNSSFRFTPAGTMRASDRAITVVVRQKSTDVNAVAVREGVASATPGAGVITATGIAPVSYSLGAAKGWKSFALPVKNLGSNVPDLAELGQLQSPEEKIGGKKSRFNPRMSVDATAPVGAAPRALDSSQKDLSVDVGGSYSLTRRLNLTAGVRISTERDRMAPLTDSRQDSQAVYVGTQIRF